MSRTSLIAIAIIIVIAIVAIITFFVGQQNASNATPPSETATTTDTATDQANDAAVRATVTNFGESMKNVSLLASNTVLASSMQSAYASTVAPTLIQTWINDPQGAIGRTVSSPWPDHITINTVVKNPDGTYRVDGTVVEVSSSDMATSGGSTSEYPIVLTLENQNGSWLITDVETGSFSS
jgi:hypothetical protein